MSEIEAEPLRQMTDWLGRSVVLYLEHWQHICLEHPDLVHTLTSEDGVLSAIAQAVETPVLVRQDERRSWVAHVFGHTSIGIFIRVIIWYAEPDTGVIHTAHLIKRLGRKGAQLWP